MEFLRAVNLLKYPKGKVGAKPTSLPRERTVVTPDQVQKACCSCVSHFHVLKPVVSAVSVVHSQAAPALDSSSSEHPSDWKVSLYSLFNGFEYGFPTKQCAVFEDRCVFYPKSSVWTPDLVPYLPVASLPLHVLC